jgi:hypothetical protein
VGLLLVVVVVVVVERVVNGEIVVLSYIFKFGSQRIKWVVCKHLAISSQLKPFLRLSLKDFELMRLVYHHAHIFLLGLMAVFLELNTYGNLKT